MWRKDGLIRSPVDLREQNKQLPDALVDDGEATGSSREALNLEYQRHSCRSKKIASSPHDACTIGDAAEPSLTMINVIGSEDMLSHAQNAASDRMRFSSTEDVVVLL